MRSITRLYGTGTQFHFGVLDRSEINTRSGFISVTFEFLCICYSWSEKTSCKRGLNIWILKHTDFG